MSNPSAFIGDGYDLHGFIPAEDGLHPALRFKYRPLSPRERARWNDTVAGVKTQEKAREATARVLAAQIQWWDVTDRAPTVPELTDQLLPPLFDKLMNIVWGLAPNGVDPDWSAEESAGNSSPGSS